MDDSLIESSMITKGQYVVYGTNGICLVEDVRMMKFALDTEKNPYCILKPASSDSSTIYVPLNNEKLMGKLRPVMTKKEIGKALSATDENTLKSAEKLVEEEFSYALHIPREEVTGYIRSLLGVTEAGTLQGE